LETCRVAPHRLTLSEVRLFDADTTLVAWLPQANLSYTRSTSRPAVVLSSRPAPAVIKSCSTRTAG